MQQPRITTTRRVDHSVSVWLVTLEGEHDVATASDLGESLDRVASTGTRAVVDLSRAEFLDSGILAVLLEAGQHGFVVVAPPGSLATRLLELTNADNILSVFPTRESAIDACLRRDAPLPLTILTTPSS